MTECVFAEPIKNGWTPQPDKFLNGKCVGGPVRGCCQETGMQIEPSKSSQVLLEVAEAARNSNNSAMYLGVLGAISAIEAESGETLL
jgi:hypothetical protein